MEANWARSFGSIHCRLVPARRPPLLFELRSVRSPFGRPMAKRRRNERGSFVVPNQTMVIGLTGASGLLGHEIIRQAVSLGNQFVAYSLAPNQPAYSAVGTQPLDP